MKMFNEGLAKLKKNGEYDKIIERYTGEKATHAKKEKAANSHTIIGLLKENGGVIVSGLFETIKLTVISIICATLFGILIGFLGVVPNKIAQGVSGTVIYIFRGLPLIVLALFIYNGIPSLTGSKIPAFVAGVITLMLNEGAYIAAFVKGGIEAVDSGRCQESWPSVWKSDAQSCFASRNQNHDTFIYQSVYHYLEGYFDSFCYRFA